MKILSLMALLVTGLAHAEYPPPADVEYLLNSAPSPANMQRTQLGTQLVNKKLQLMKASFNSTVQGTTVGFKTLNDIDGKPAFLPKNAIIKNVFVETLVDMSNYQPTDPMYIQIGLSTIPGDLLQSRLVTDFRSTVFLYGRDASSTLYKLPARSTVNVKFIPASCVAANYQTASCNNGSGAGVGKGKFNVWIEYFIGGQALDPGPTQQ